MYIELSRHYCYLHGTTLQGMWDTDEVLELMMDVVGVEGKATTLRRLSPKDQRKAIEQRLDHKRTSRGSEFEGAETAEILAACLWDGLSAKDRAQFFAPVKKEADLFEPVADWLVEKGYDVCDEVPMGTKRVDVVGTKPGGFWSSRKVVSVELKNDLQQLKRGLDQMTTFAQYSHIVYLACTPDMAAEYLFAHLKGRSVHKWDGEVLNHKLRQFGFGLLLVGGDEVVEVVQPRSLSPSSDKVDEVFAHIEEATE